MSSRVQRTAVYAAALLLFLAMVFTLPPNMDEFVHYLPLACRHHPLQQDYTGFRSGCGQYDLQILGQWWQARTLPYTGSAPSLLYAPFFALWKHWWSARLIDGAALVVLAVFLSRAVGLILPWSLWVVGWCFPLALQTAVDTGPVSFQLSTLVGVPLLAAGWVSDAGQVGKFNAKRWGSSLLMGLGVWISLWNKPFFAMQIPAMVALTAWLLWADPKKGLNASTLKRVVVGSLPGALLAILATVWIFSASTRYGSTFFEDLASVRESYGWGQWAEMAAHWADSSKYFLDFLAFAHRIYFDKAPWALSGWTLALWLLAGVLVVGAVFCGPLETRTRDRRYLAVLAVLSFGAWVVTVVLTHRVSTPFSGHHVIFLVPLLLLMPVASGVILARRHQKWVIAAFVLYLFLNGAHMVRGWNTPPDTLNDFSRLPVMKWAMRDEIGSKTVILVGDWGVYFTLALYGSPQQLVLYVEPFSQPEQAARVREILAKENRKAIFILRRDSWGTDVRLLQTYFPRLQRVVMAESNPQTDLWMALAEPF